MVVTVLPIHTGATLYVAPTFSAFCTAGRVLIRPSEVARYALMIRRWALRTRPDLWSVLAEVARVTASIPYERDPDDLFGRDLWRSPAALVAHGQGDCEDHAIFAASMLLAIGYRAVLVVGTLNGNAHAWVEGADAWGREFLLEGTPPEHSVSDGAVYRGRPASYKAELIITARGCVHLA